MSIFSKLFKEKKRINVSKSYLKELINKTNNKISYYKYINIDENNKEISYMSTKNVSFIGLQLGLAEQYKLNKYNIKENDSIKSNAKNYLKLFKQDNKIVKIESYVNGRIDVIYLAFYEDNMRFLIPFTKDGNYYPTYISVSHFINDFVDEEYLVNGNKIIYSKYINTSDNKIDYYYINYVLSGKHPILEELRGYYLVDNLELIEDKHNYWC